MSPTPKDRVPDTSGFRFDFLENIQGLLRGLQTCRASQAISFTLESIREAFNADCVYSCSPTVGANVIRVGPIALTPQYCSRFLKKRLTKNPEDTAFLWSPSGDGPRNSSRQPQNVALIRFGNCAARSPWVVALGLHGEGKFDNGHLQYLCAVRDIYLNQQRASKAHSQLRESLVDLVRCLTMTIDARDPLTRNHSERVARIALVLGRQMRLSGKVNSDLYLAGLLHDVGKIGIRDAVLFKDGKLTAAEYAHIQEHAVIGDRVVARIKQFEHLRAGVRNHHERYDGTGYPDRLSGERIPLLARILALADAYDAMRSTRRYRDGMPMSQVDRIIAEGAGTQFDPAVVHHYMACRHTICDLIVNQKAIGDTDDAVLTLVEAIKDWSSTSHPTLIDRSEG